MLDYRLSELWLSQDLTHERCQLYLIALQWFEKYSVEEFLFFKNLKVTELKRCANIPF